MSKTSIVINKCCLINDYLLLIIVGILQCLFSTLNPVFFDKVSISRLWNILYGECKFQKDEMMVARFVPLVIEHNPGYKS